MDYYKQKIATLEREKETMALWAQVYNTPLGRKALAELRARKEAARDAYGKIPATSPNALTMLIEAQHAEKFTSQLIQSVADAESRKKAIDIEIERVVEQYNRDKGVRREDDVALTGEKNGN